MKKTIISTFCALLICSMALGQTAYGLQTKKEAEAGDSFSQYQLGFYYESGQEGFAVNYPLAIKWYKLSNEQSPSSNVCSIIARLYLRLNDQRNAIDWFKKAQDLYYAKENTINNSIDAELKRLGISYTPSLSTQQPIFIVFAPYKNSLIFDAALKTKRGEIKSKEIKKSYEHVQVVFAHDTIWVSLSIINEDRNSAKPHELVSSMFFKSSLSNLLFLKDNRGNIVGIQISDNETRLILHKDKKKVMLVDKVKDSTWAMSYDEGFANLMSLAGNYVSEPESFDENFNTLIKEVKRLKWKSYK